MQKEQFLHELLNLPQVWPYGLKLSPDGKWVAFNWYQRHANLDVFVVPTDGSSKPVALTRTDETSFFVSWAPDSKSVIVSEDHDRDERSRLFRVFLDKPEEMQPLTMDRPPYFMRGGSLSPCGQYVYYGINFDIQEEEVIEATWLYKHDLESGNIVPVAKPEVPHWVSPSLNKAGTHLLYDRTDRNPNGIQIHLLDLQSGVDSEILNFGDEVKIFANWFPDGERVLVLSESTGKGAQQHTSLGVYDIKTSETRWLIDDPQRNIESAVVSKDGTIFVHEVEQARTRASALNADTGEEQFFPDIPGNLIPLGSNPQGEWIGTYYSATTPTELVCFDRDLVTAGELHSLTKVWELTNIQQSDLTEAESLTWKSVDGMQVQGWLYKAQTNPKRAIIYVHGGPTAHSEDSLNEELQYYVSQGFNVLDINYRGSTGFGLTYREAIKEDGFGGREQADIAAGAQMLIDMGLAEAGHIGVTGTSYGGFSSWFQITRTPLEQIAASAPICGMTDLVVDYETTRPDLRSYSIEMMGGTPDEVPERYHNQSPINFVQDIKGKLLIIQGALDPNVTPANVIEVEKKLKEFNIAYETLIFEDEGHGIIKTKNKETLLQKLVEFFNSAI